MKKAISAIITVRGSEPYLARTIQNIRNRAGCPVEVVVVYDGTEPAKDLDCDQIIQLKTPKGVGAARHAGIEAAEHEIVFLTDAHMDFSMGFGDMVAKYHGKKENASHITCGCCVPMFDRGGKLFWNEAERNTGARFCLVSDEPGREMWIMSGKWAKHEPGEAVGCVYGACYGMRKSWYKKIGSPLALLTGWGMDEEYLSAATWMASGQCTLLGYDAAHLFRATPSFNTGRVDAFLRMLNRARFVHLLPADQEAADKMDVALNLNLLWHDIEFGRHYQHDLARPEVQAAKALWSSWDWSNLAPWIDYAPESLEKRRQAAERRRRDPVAVVLGSSSSVIPTTQLRPGFQCPNCKGINTFRQRSTETVRGEVRRYGKCRLCRLGGRVIIRDGFEKIHWNQIVI